MDRISLWYCEGASDKVYEAEIVPVSDGLQVNFAYGRRGGTMNTGTKTSKPMPYAQARRRHPLCSQEAAEDGARGEGIAGQVDDVVVEGSPGIIRRLDVHGAVVV